MALIYHDGRFAGGRFPPEVEALLAAVVGRHCGQRGVTVRYLHDVACGLLADQGYRSVSYAALAARVRAFATASPTHYLFTQQVPIDLVLVDASGRPLGRPLVTLSGRVVVDRGRVRLRSRIEVSLPPAASTGDTLRVRTSGSARSWRLKDGPGRIRPIPATTPVVGDPDVAFILDLLRREGPELPFDRIVRAMGSEPAASAVVDHLVSSRHVVSDPPGPIYLLSVIRLLPGAQRRVAS